MTSRPLTPIQRKVQVWALWRPDAGAEARVLLLRTRPERGSFWQPITGSVEAEDGVASGAGAGATDATFARAAARELSEETGFAEVPSPLGFGFEFTRADGASVQERVFVVVAVAALAGSAGAPPAPRLDPREHSEHAWVEPNRVQEFIRFESNRIAWEHARAKNFASSARR